MKWCVVISNSNWPTKVLGPLRQETAEKIAAGYSFGAAEQGTKAIALPVTKP